MGQESKNLSSLLIAASPSTVSLSTVTSSQANVSSASMSSTTGLSTLSVVKSEVKQEVSDGIKQEPDSEEKMDIKTEGETKMEVNSVKDENDTSSPKLESTDDASQSIKKENSVTGGDASNNASTGTAKLRLKKGERHSKLFWLNDAFHA